jgi:hypothetical protein
MLLRGEPMIKTPVKFKKPMSLGLKKYVTHVQNLVAKGKAGTEEDARIIINDILADVLGYDKYNDLKTEFKDKNGILDYVVKLSEGPLAKKKERFDFMIEAKAAHIELKENHVNQALTYCLTANIDFFMLTNARDWHLYKVNKSKAKNEAALIWEVNLNSGDDIDSLVDEMYVLSKHSYIEEKWNFISDHSKATDMGDIMAIIYSDKFVKNICKSLKDIHDVKIVDEVIREILNDKVFKEMNKINKNLLKKLNTVELKPADKKTSDAVVDCPPPFLSEDTEKKTA